MSGPQGLKPYILFASSGTTQVVPFPILPLAPAIVEGE